MLILSRLALTTLMFFATLAYAPTLPFERAPQFAETLETRTPERFTHFAALQEMPAYIHVSAVERVSMTTEYANASVTTPESSDDAGSTSQLNLADMASRLESAWQPENQGSGSGPRPSLRPFGPRMYLDAAASPRRFSNQTGAPPQQSVDDEDDPTQGSPGDDSQAPDTGIPDSPPPSQTPDSPEPPAPSDPQTPDVPDDGGPNVPPLPDDPHPPTPPVVTVPEPSSLGLLALGLLGLGASRRRKRH